MLGCAAKVKVTAMYPFMEDLNDSFKYPKTVLPHSNPHPPRKEEPLFGAGHLILSTFITMRAPSLNGELGFFYLFSFEDIDDSLLSNVQFSEMDGTAQTGSSRKSYLACLHEHVLEQPFSFQPDWPCCPALRGKAVRGPIGR